MGTSTCAVCGAATDPLLRVCANADGRLEGDWWVHRCRGCGSGITVPRPSPQTTERLYAEGVYEKAGGRGTGFGRVLDLLLDLRLREIARLRAPGDLLDVGCGKGRFLARAARKGWRACGLERTPAQARSALARVQAGRVVMGDLGAFRDGSFDVVTAWHVLEHLAAPGVVLGGMFRLLRPGGVLACEVPNFASWQARLSGASWFHLDVPRHLVHFTAESLARVVEATGFRVEHTTTTSLEMGPFGMLQSTLTAAGLDPALLFRWMKRSAPRASVVGVTASLGASALALVPSLVAELGAMAVGRGGIVRVLAVRP